MDVVTGGMQGISAQGCYDLWIVFDSMPVRPKRR